MYFLNAFFLNVGQTGGENVPAANVPVAPGENSGTFSIQQPYKNVHEKSRQSALAFDNLVKLPTLHSQN